MMQYIFPCILIACDLGAALVSLYHRDGRKALYWLAAAVLTASVTF
jgi:hypothetical protein